MNLVTSCPTCGTLFRVVPDQLRISDGWVRCGQCAKVFDAHLQMQAVAAEPQVLATAAEVAMAPPAVVEVPASDLADADAAAPEPPPDPEPDEAPEEDLEEAAPSALTDDSLWPDEAATTLPPAEGEPAAEEDTEAEVASPAFVRAADRRAFWQGRSVRGALSVLAGLLGLLLAGQVLVQERDRIAAHAPATAPLLAALCAPLGCSVQPWRQIDAVVIDSSAFVKLEPQRYQLSLVLRNTAVVPLALPAIELSLTDSTDQAVMRRVVTPADWGAASPVLAAGGESAASVTLALADGPAAAAVTGYRVLAFYP